MPRVHGLVIVGAVCVVAAAALAPGCTCREEDRFDGVIESEAPMKAPIGGEDACAVRLRVDYYNQISSGASSANRTWTERAETRYAPGATFVVDGKRLVLVGAGGTPSFLALRQGGSWGMGGGPAPQGLRGWDRELDRLLAIANGESPPGSIVRITFHEEVLPCGAKVGLRGVVAGDRFVLHPEKVRPSGAVGS